MERLSPPGPGSGSRPLRLKAVGDIMVTTRVSAALAEHGPAYPFAPVAPLLRQAGITFGNMEMPIATDPTLRPAFPEVCPDFRAPAATAEALRLAGFTLLNLANNHTMDWGEAGLLETMDRLHAAGIRTIGAGRTLEEARRPAIVEADGRTVAFLGYGVPGPWSAGPARPGCAPIAPEAILEDLRAVRDRVDLTVVSLHTGVLSHYPNPEDRRLARALIDNGACLVLGHGPHILQGIELYRDRTIAYSLGNFLLDIDAGNVEMHVARREQLETVILDVAIEADGRSTATALPVTITDAMQAAPAAGADAEHILGRLSELSANLERMHGLALWEHAGQLTVEHEVRVLWFQAREVDLSRALRRLTKIRWRHIRLLLGYLLGRSRAALGRAGR